MPESQTTEEQKPPQLDAMVAISSAAAMVNPITVTSSAPTHLAFGLPVQAVQPPPPPPFAFNPALLPQGPPQMQLPAFFHGHLPMQLHPATVAPPPPPPPPQLPLALANMGPIYMQLAPTPVEALQLNAIPAPKEFDLNAIPKPQINLEAIQMPTIAGHPGEQLSMLTEHVNHHPPPPPPPMLEEVEVPQQQPQTVVTQHPPQAQNQLPPAAAPPQGVCHF